MIGILAVIIINIVCLVLNKLLAPHVAPPGPFQAPQARVGVPIPVFYGTVQIAPNTVWFGNAFKRQDGNYFAYAADMVNIIGWGVVNELVDITFGGKSARNNSIFGGDPVLTGGIRGPNFLQPGAFVTITRPGHVDTEVGLIVSLSVDSYVLGVSGLVSAHNGAALLDPTTGETVPTSDPRAIAYVGGSIVYNDETRTIIGIRGPLATDTYVLIISAPFGQLGVFLPQGNGHDPAFPGPGLVIVNGDQNTNGDNTPSMFGGEKQGGGPEGDIFFHWGWDAQPVNSTVAGWWGGANVTSGYPKLCYAVFTAGIVQFSVGSTLVTLSTGSFQWTWNNPTPPEVQFVVRRTAWCEGPVSPLGSIPETYVFPTATSGNLIVTGNMTLGNDANPAEILYDLMTSTLYGLGLDPTLIDVPSFSAAASYLRTEVISPTKTGFGLSLIVNDTKEAVSAIGGILNHIDGVIAMDPETGQLQMTLIRSGYTFNDLLVVNADNASDLRFTRGTWRETINEVVITYSQFGNNSVTRGLIASSVTAQDLANRYATGGVRSQSFNMPYVTHVDVASLIAARQLRKVAFPAANLQFKMSRAGHRLRPGDVINFSWAALGISQMAVRILDVNYGTLQDGTMEVTGTEDTFNVASASYTSPPASGWVEPNQAALVGYGYGYGFTYGQGQEI